MASNRGIFVPTYIGYQNKTPEAQAKEILNTVYYYKKQGYNQVGITYSANHDQTKKIRKTYGEGEWRTGTTGDNQAAVIAKVEELLATDQYKNLQPVFRILPITTCKYARGIGPIKPEWLEDEDLPAIKNFISRQNVVVLGWQNEKANDNTPAKKFAIGGGTSQHLKALLPNQGGMTADQYVQQELTKLANNNKSNNNESPPTIDASTMPEPRPPAPQSSPPKIIKGKVWGLIGGILAGLLVGAIPLFMILLGIITLPATFGGSAALIGIGLAVLFGGVLGSWGGYKIGTIFDMFASSKAAKQQANSNPVPNNTTTDVSRRLGSRGRGNPNLNQGLNQNLPSAPPMEVDYKAMDDFTNPIDLPPPSNNSKKRP